MDSTTSVCSICDEALSNETDNTTNVRTKGLQTLIERSKLLEDDKWKQWENLSSLTVHGKCRKWYALASKKSVIARATRPSSPLPSTSSEETLSIIAGYAPTPNDFDFRASCFICAKTWRCKNRPGSLVQHAYMREGILEVAEKRGDASGMKVICRLEGIESLVNVAARYHADCWRNFSRIDPKKPENETKQAQIEATFKLVTDYIEASKVGKFKLAELYKEMGEGALSTQVLYRKLNEKYGDDIHILPHRGAETLIFYKCFSASKLCGDWYRDPTCLNEKQQQAIVDVAAELIRKQIENSHVESDSHKPAANFLSDVHNDVPSLLRGFMDKLIVSEKHKDDTRLVLRDTIAHSILSAVRPPTFTSNLQLAIGIYIYRKSGSRLIIDLLHKLGFCSSYYHLQQYEASVIMDPPKCIIGAEAQVQHVFDNTDHNVGTLDGHRTYHCLGGIAIYTPEFEVTYEGHTKKLKDIAKVNAATLASRNVTRNISFVAKSNGLENIEFVDTEKLLRHKSDALPVTYLTYLWAKHCGQKDVPSWKGFMEVLSRFTTYHVSKVICLPFINEPPSNFTTINTALHKALEEAKRLNKKTCFVTFDQPLYYKARNIIEASEGALKDVTVRLGGFHMLMSYLGAIGYIMTGSGLENVWAVTYAPESVKRMIGGHAYARAMRAHILTFTAIGIIICREFKNDKREAFDEFFSSFLNEWDSEPPQLGDCEVQPTILEMKEEFNAQLNDLKNRGPTAQLWIQYFECIVVALQFVEAERLGNWDLHLQSVQKMLPIFHAAGHSSYAKSAQIYLQDMTNLESIMPHDEFVAFTTDGYFTVRRSDKPWSGVWTDMTIEQTLNRFFGTDLKHGRGVTPSVITRYLAAMPSSFSIMECLEEYCGITSSSSEQHIDLANHRMKRDNDDINKFVFWFHEHSLFRPRTSSVSLSTGIVGDAFTDCHLAVEKGHKAMTWMLGQSAGKISMSATYKVKNLGAAKTGIHIDNGHSHSVDSSLLFQRISVVFRGDEQRTRKAFEYELSPFPLAFFDELGFMRKTQKSELYKIFKPFSLRGDNILRSMTFVIDGGFLLHNVCWPHGQTFKHICEIYRNHIVSHYKDTAKVVFDGYSGQHLSIKSYERYRRRESNMAPDIDFTENTLVTLSQTKFLSNVKNKFKFVEMLSRYLDTHGIVVKVAREDADRLIVQTAIDYSRSTGRNVAVVGNDTDLFVLLIALSDAGSHSNYLYKVTPAAKKNELYAAHDHVDLKPFILFAHAFAGCDTTSAMYGKGKKTIISILKKNPDLQALIDKFSNPGSTIDSLSAGAKRLMALLYNFHPEQSIKDARYNKFSSSAVHGKTEVRLAQLPPTESVLCEHTKRTYYQVQSWLGNELDAEDWGWKRTDTMMMPVMNTKNPAPQDLLTMVMCGCTGNCKTARCSCKKAGLPCTQLCKHCNGVNCDNASATATASATNTLANIEERFNDAIDEPDSSEFITIAANLDSDDAFSSSEEDEVENDTDEETVDESMEID